MASGSWSRTANLAWMDEKAREDMYRENTRATLHPQTGEMLQGLMQDYPWLQPGTAFSLAKVGIPSDHPLATAVARLEYQNRSDWSQPGGNISNPQAPDPSPPEQDISLEPSLPPVAPAPDSPAAVQSLLNPTPQPGAANGTT